MRVGQIMKTNVVTIAPNKRVGQALRLMKKHNIRHLPVVQDDKMVGWITSRVLREVLLASMLEIITVGDVMIQAPITVTPDTSVEEAARLLYENKIGGMPVMEEGKLVGVITTMDLLAAFLSMLGLLRGSSRLDLLLEDKPEVLEKAAAVIKEAGAKIMNVALGPVKQGKRSFFFRLNKCDLAPVLEALKKHKFKVVDYIP